MIENEASIVGRAETVPERAGAEPAAAERAASDRRRERRFPAVGITLLFSPARGGILQHAAQWLREATAIDMSVSGISFDVRESMEPGDELLIQVEDPAGGAAEKLLAEVRWCYPIEETHFRIGTRIKEAVDGLVAAGETAIRQIGHGPAVPTGAELRCPGCSSQASFTFVGLQSGPWEEGVLPLYQCSVCESSRSIATILAYNRELA